MSICHVIKDTASELYYQQSFNRKTGWYGPIGGVRLYQSHEAARRVLSRYDHHVSYPGNRTLEIVRVNVAEEPALLE